MKYDLDNVKWLSEDETNLYKCILNDGYDAKEVSIEEHLDYDKNELFIDVYVILLAYGDEYIYNDTIDVNSNSWWIDIGNSSSQFILNYKKLYNKMIKSIDIKETDDNQLTFL